MLWFIRRKTPLNLLLFSKLNGLKECLNRTEFLELAKERIDRLDVSSAIEDIIHFTREQDAIKRTWSKEYFNYWIDNILTVP